jgi:hypothetical protein
MTPFIPANCSTITMHRQVGPSGRQQCELRNHLLGELQQQQQQGHRAAVAAAAAAKSSSMQI